MLNAAAVEYLVVGAYAVARYGHVRATGDIDVWVKPSVENSQRVVAVLKQFGLGGLGYTINDFIELDSIVQLGVAPLRIDLLTSVDGVDFDTCYKQRKIKVLVEVPISFISLICDRIKPVRVDLKTSLICRTWRRKMICSK